LDTKLVLQIQQINSKTYLSPKNIGVSVPVLGYITHTVGAFNVPIFVDNGIQNLVDISC
jgi:hypothetical protein